MNNILICTYDEQLIPEKKTSEAIGWDIKAANKNILQPHELKLISAGIKTYMPAGWCCKIYARSSLPLKNGLMLANSVALIDSDYRGEYFMQIYNFTDKPIIIEKYMRLCQLSFEPHYRGEGKFGTEKIPNIEIRVDEKTYENFSEIYTSERGVGGLGSTGKI